MPLFPQTWNWSQRAFIGTKPCLHQLNIQSTTTELLEPSHGFTSLKAKNTRSEPRFHQFKSQTLEPSHTATTYKNQPISASLTGEPLEPSHVSTKLFELIKVPTSLIAITTRSESFFHQFNSQTLELSHTSITYKSQPISTSLTDKPLEPSHVSTS